MKTLSLRALAVLLTIPLLAGCGFHLRGDASLPPAMAKTYAVIEDENSSLARHLRQILEHNGVVLVGADEATAVLEVPTNRVVTEVLTIGDNARVREYRITHSVRFRLVDAKGQELLGWQNLKQSRELSFDEQKILAASREQEYLREDLAELLARQMVTRLEGVTAGQG